MVELDAKLGGAAVQHRETQGKESTKFLDYFENKIVYLDGGIESGFTHVEASKADPHLYHIKGHQKTGTMRLTQEPLRRDYMNSGDVFVLVTGPEEVFMWIGKEANKDEKAKGMDVSRNFCTKGKVKVYDEGVNDGKQEAASFWSYIPGEVSVLGPIKRKVAIQEADDKDDKGKAFLPTLYRSTYTFSLLLCVENSP
jgi:gelsolin